MTPQLSQEEKAALERIGRAIGRTSTPLTLTDAIHGAVSQAVDEASFFGELEKTPDRIADEVIQRLKEEGLNL